MSTEEKYDQIERYLSQQLSAEEVNQFEQQMKTDPELREEVALHQQVSETLKGNSVHALRGVLNDVDQEWEAEGMKAPQKGRVFSLRSALAIAATIALLVVSYFIFLPGNTTPSSEQLFASNFEAYPLLLNQRGLGDEPGDALLEQGKKAYQQRDFKEAYTAFQSLSEQEPANQVYRFYQAVSALGADQAKVAIPMLQSFTTTPNPFQEQSLWYLCLAYIQLDDVEQAKSVLQGLSEDHYLYQEAQQLLKDLD